MRHLAFATTLAATAAAVLLALGAPASGTASEVRPHCQHVVIQENSGNGPSYRVLVCGALLPSYGEGWRLVIDGGPLVSGAVIFGFRQP